ncbi:MULTISPECIES: hypothetical protein [Sporosarcina]|uniref:Uncharacterized protein n=1 Tax=Sporosarcina contaminans TaxID=633403 RepID=A0ABW3TXB6_9BACL
MNSNLSALFPSIQFFDCLPEDSPSDEYIFENNSDGYWFRIKKSEVTNRDYNLLSSLFTEVTPCATNGSISSQWLQFLEGKGAAPIKNGEKVRVIQLLFEANNGKRTDLLEAFTAFFDTGFHFIHISPRQSLIIEYEADSSTAFLLRVHLFYADLK